MSLLGSIRAFDWSGWPGAAVKKSIGPIRPAKVVFPPEPQEYVDARTELLDMANLLGFDVSNEHWQSAGVRDFLLLAYAQGWSACAAKVESPDTADAIAFAIEHPARVVDKTHLSEGLVHHVTRAVQRVVLYGVPKGPKS
jgi:hypothetical protein